MKMPSKAKHLARRIGLTFLIGVAATLDSAHAQLGGGAFEGLNDFAKRVTIGIETPGASGSGVIIGRARDGQDFAHFFLTSRHVAQGNPAHEEFYAYSASDKSANRERITKFYFPKELEGKDIAIGLFISKKRYDVAPIFALGDESSFQLWRSYNGKNVNERELIQGEAVVSGVSTPTSAIPVPLTRISSATIQDRVPGNKDGYEMIYLAVSTVPGMSGGGVFGARVCPPWGYIDESGNKSELTGAYGGLLAIHGRSESYGSSGGRSGISLGIPLDAIKQFLKKTAAEYFIPVGESYNKLVGYECVKHRFSF